MQPQIGFGHRTTQTTINSLFQQVVYKPLQVFSLMHASLRILVSIIAYILTKMKTLLLWLASLSFGLAFNGVTSQTVGRRYGGFGIVTTHS
jgi:hypothetical protein